MLIVDRVIDAASTTFGVRGSIRNAKFDLPAGLKCRVFFRTRRRPTEPLPTIDSVDHRACRSSPDRETLGLAPEGSPVACDEPRQWGWARLGNGTKLAHLEKDALMPIRLRSHMVRLLLSTLILLIAMAAREVRWRAFFIRLSAMSKDRSPIQALSPTFS